MTENRRIFWNIVFSYARSLLGLFGGLFISRWVLMALGQVDYGLFGLIGGLIVFFQFVNDNCAAATARFYAFAIGETKRDQLTGIDNCRHWFNTALVIHTILPCILLVIGYPIGIYAIKHWLTIPIDRVAACIWVFRFACISALIAMINVPFTAMYTAKQYIAELTVYSMGTTILNIIFAYYMASHPGLWLTKYAAWMCVMAILPQLIICIRANYVFKECKFIWKYMWSKTHLVQIISFSGWHFLSTFCWVLRTQGIALLINKAFGPQLNASMNIANQVNSKTSALASALLKAFTPAITTACGEKNYTRMFMLALSSCKFSTLLSLIFVIPLMLELPTVVHLWLQNPPPCTVGLCQLMLIYYLCQMCTTGHLIVVNASGNIKQYYSVLSSISVCVLPVAILTVCLGGGVYSVGVVLIVGNIINSCGRIYFAQKLLHLSAWQWIKTVFYPLFLISVLTAGIAWLPHLWIKSGLPRIMITIVLSESIMLPTTWMILLNSQEKAFMVSKLKVMIHKCFN